MIVYLILWWITGGIIILIGIGMARREPDIVTILIGIIVMAIGCIIIIHGSFKTFVNFFVELAAEEG
ncbi:MAG: hypothetical protein M5U10_10735 [Candidatus Methanoperedens sp.]|nr:hypothetical protein [Candidatus Methanoperedens nitroreducens]MDJ1422378.1 hypothetical protein [Candidatus Methanoperedens sp.]